MDRECEQIEHIGELLSLPPDHPRRIHAANCPQCRILLAAYKEFLRADELENTDLETTRPKSKANDDNLIENESLVEPVLPWTGLIEKLRAAWDWRPVLVITAGVVVAVAAGIGFQQENQPRTLVLRGDNTAQNERILGLNEPEVLEAGEIRLSWTPHPDADAYIVRLISSEFGEINHFEAVTDTAIVLYSKEISPAALPGNKILWTVTAVKHGDEMFDSSPGILKIP